MTKHWKSVLGLTAAATLAVCFLPAQQAETHPLPPSAVAPGLMPTAKPTPAIENLKLRMQQMIAVRDAETGELRAATAREHEELVRSGRSRSAKIARPEQRSAAAAEEVYLPNGAVALSGDVAQLEFLVVQRAADGSMKYTCGNPLHQHGSVETAQKGGDSNEK